MNQKKECMDVHVNGLKFHVQTFGSGVPIIMIMGLGAPGDKWKHNYELLSKWFWCIVPDNRGAGLSDKPEAKSYTTEQMADDIIGIRCIRYQKSPCYGCLYGRRHCTAGGTESSGQSSESDFDKYICKCKSGI